jgi:hypothetical protein
MRSIVNDDARDGVPAALRLAVSANVWRSCYKLHVLPTSVSVFSAYLFHILVSSAICIV